MTTDYHIREFPSTLQVLLNGDVIAEVPKPYSPMSKRDWQKVLRAAILKNARLFKSLDPVWPKWGVSGVSASTQWFNRKADAECFIKTGNLIGSVSKQPSNP